MLKFISVRESQEKNLLLETFDPTCQTWVVSDLKSKLEIQKILLEKNGFLQEEAVLRVSELWKKMLARLRPELRTVSADFSRTLMSQWLKDTDFSWAQTPGASQTLYQYIQQLLPILCHPNGEDLLEGWFEDHPESLIRWKHWYQLAFLAWQRFLDEKLITSSWFSGVLVNEPELGEAWQRDFVFDLGPDLTSVEADVIKILAKKREVEVIVPAPEWERRYRKTLLGYSILKEDNQNLNEPSSEVEAEIGAFKKPGRERISFHKYTTMIAEVKGVTAQVRQWLDQGVPVEQIAVMAPDIEIFWPSLKSYMQEEGIPVDKDVVVTLQTFPMVFQWLSRLRMHAGKVSAADLEVSLYSAESAYKMPFDRFRSLFSVIYDHQDLFRDEDIANLYEREIVADSLLQREEFVAWTLRYWDEKAEPEALEKIFYVLFQECPQSVQLNLEDWMLYLEKICAKVEAKVEDADMDGIQCVNLSSGEWLKVSHVCILGLTEEALKQIENTGLTLSDVLSLSQQVGFNLSYPDKAHTEFEARWLVERDWAQIGLSVSGTDFNGSVQAPSLLWLLGSLWSGRDSEELDVPSPTRWDEMQKCSAQLISSLRRWPEVHAEMMDQSILEDLGIKDGKSYGDKFGFSISASQLENYQKCPFIFASQKLFHLSDLPNVDLDVDRMTRGKLMHALFETLSEEPMRFSWSDQELDQVLSDCRVREKIHLADERVWPALAKKYKDLAQRFLQFEKEWREKHPKTKTLGRELSVEAEWCLKQKKLMPPDKDADGRCKSYRIPFKGFIDRVDGDNEGNYVVIDYKSSAGQVRNHSSWLDKGSFQLALYSQAVEDGLTELESGKVTGAFYFVSRTLDRDKGFRLDEGDESLFPLPKRSRNRVNLSDRNKMFEQINSKVQTLIEQMQTGHFHPSPKDSQDCFSCQWRMICRAPHLN